MYETFCGVRAVPDQVVTTRIASVRAAFIVVLPIRMIFIAVACGDRRKRRIIPI